MSWVKAALVVSIALASVACTTTVKRSPYVKPDELRRYNGPDETAPRHPDSLREPSSDRDRDRDRDRMLDDLERQQEERDRDREQQMQQMLQQQQEQQQQGGGGMGGGNDCPSCR